MLRVLVVDDDLNKVRALVRVLKAAGVQDQDIDTASCSQDARRRLMEERYDILIIDVALPETLDSDVSPMGGIELLRDLVRQDGYIVPSQIVGITGHRDIVADATTAFGQQGFVFLEYRAEGGPWSEVLPSMVKYMLRMADQQAPSPFRTDVAVVCALGEPELKAMLRTGLKWQELKFPADNTYYHRATFTAKGKERVIHAAAATRMGTESSALLAAKMIQHFRPRYLAMAGIAAALDSKIRPGDVVVADPVWNWGSGKLSVRDGQSVFEAAPHQIELDSELRERFRRMARSKGRLAEIRDQFGGNDVGHDLAVHVGPFATGAAVLADSREADKVRGQHRKVLAVDMEVYGVYAAAQEATEARPRAFALKGIVDYADPNKGDSWQKYGAFTSAAVLMEFIRNWLFD